MMQHNTHRAARSRLIVAAVLVTVGLAATACSSSSDYVYVDPAAVEEVDANLWQIELTERAAERTGLETVEVATHQVDGVDRLCIPYSAVMYHFDGTEWTYTNPSALTYVREPIEIDYIEGDLAILNTGPDVGTVVVSVGAAELYGVEFGIGK
ncbi:MAG: hypothetical protein ACR2P0_15995 [Acidimicrobiales bacterium]